MEPTATPLSNRYPQSVQRSQRRVTIAETPSVVRRLLFTPGTVERRPPPTPRSLMNRTTQFIGSPNVLTKLFQCTDEELHQAIQPWLPFLKSFLMRFTPEVLVKKTVQYLCVELARLIYPELVERIEKGEELSQEDSVDRNFFIPHVLHYFFSVALEELEKIFAALDAGVPPKKELYFDLIERLLKPFLLERMVERQKESLAVKVHHLFAVYVLKKPYLVMDVVEENKSSSFSGLPRNLNILLEAISQYASTVAYEEIENKEFISALSESIPAWIPLLEEEATKSFPILKKLSPEQKTLLLQTGLTILVAKLLKASEKVLRKHQLETNDPYIALTLLGREFFYAMSQTPKDLSYSPEHCRKKIFQFIECYFDESPWIEIILRYFFSEKVDQVASLFSQFQAVNSKEVREEALSNLREIFLNQEKFKKDFPQVKWVSPPNPTIAELGGVEPTVQQIKAIAIWTGKTIVNNKEAFCEDAFLEKLAMKFSHDPEIVQEVFKALQAVKNTFLLVDKINYDFDAFLEKQVTDLILYYLIAFSQEGSQDKTKVMFKAFLHLLAAAKNPLQFISNYPVHSVLSIPEAYGAYLEQRFLWPHLPDIVDNSLMELNLWMSLGKEGRKQIQKRYGSPRPLSLLKGVAHFVKQFVPFLLETESKSFSHETLEILRKEAFEEGISPHLEEQLTSVFKEIRTSQDPLVEGSLEFLKDYVEAVLIKVFKEFSENIYVVDGGLIRHNLWLVEKVLQIFLVEANHHFDLIQKGMTRHGVSRVIELQEEDIEDLLKKEKALHPALDINEPENIEEYYRNLTARILKLCNLSKEQGVPAPSFLKNPAWDLATQTLLPKVIRGLIDVIKAPESIYTYLHSLLTVINKSLHEVEENKSSVGPVKIPDDDLQKSLSQESAKLVELLVGLHTSLAGGLLKWRSIKEIAGESVGKAAREAIHKKTTIDLILNLVESIMPTFHAGGWVTKPELSYLRVHNVMPTLNPKSGGGYYLPLKPDGTEGWDYKMPKGARAREAYIQNQQKKNEEIRINDIELLAQMIRTQTILSLEAARKGVSDLLYEKLERRAISQGPFIEKLFNGVALVSRVVWKFFIHPLLFVATYPLRVLFDLGLMYYARTQAEARIGYLQKLVLPNLLLKALDAFLDLIEEELARAHAATPAAYGKAEQVFS